MDYRYAERSLGLLRNLTHWSFYSFRSNSASYAGLLEWDKASLDAKECIRLDPTFVKGYYRLASAQIELKQLDLAESTIRQGMQVEKEANNSSPLAKQLRLVKQLQKKQDSATETSPPVNNAAGIQLDEATSKELHELQTQYTFTNRELATCQANVQLCQREAKIAQLCHSELEPIDAAANCYRSIGKIFFKSTKPKVMQHLQSKMEDYSKTESDTKLKMEYLERQLKSQRENIDEILVTATGNARASATATE